MYQFKQNRAYCSNEHFWLSLYEALHYNVNSMVTIIQTKSQYGDNFENDEKSKIVKSSKVGRPTVGRFYCKVMPIRGTKGMLMTMDDAISLRWCNSDDCRAF